MRSVSSGVVYAALASSHSRERTMLLQHREGSGEILVRPTAARGRIRWLWQLGGYSLLSIDVRSGRASSLPLPTDERRP